MLTSSVTDRHLLRLWYRGAFIPRLVFVTIATLFLVFWNLYQSIGYTSYAAILVSFSTALSLYLGSKFDIQAFAFRKPKWTNGFILSFLVYSFLTVIVEESINSNQFVSFGIFINLAYLGAKIGCTKLGCCGIKSIKDKHFFGWPFRPRLQSFELMITIVILMFGIFVFFIDLGPTSAFLLIAGHGTLRIFAGLYRFPYKRVSDFLFERSGLVVLLGFVGFLT
jgi:hypothetical protein